MTELLKKPIWSNADIMQYFNIGKTKASKVSQAAKLHYNGIVLMDLKKVYRDAVFRVFGLDAKEEIKRWNSEINK